MNVYVASASDTSVTFALVTIVGAVITALFKLLTDNTKALTKLSKSNEKIAAETAKGNREAKARNGHLGEQNIKITELIADMKTEMKTDLDRNYQAFSNVKEQHVESQHVFVSDVGTEVVNSKEDANETT